MGNPMCNPCAKEHSNNAPAGLSQRGACALISSLMVMYESNAARAVSFAQLHRQRRLKALRQPKAGLGCAPTLSSPLKPSAA